VVPSITISTTIPLPISAVWDELRHIDRHVEWMNDAVALTFVNGQREGVGTSFHCKTKIGPFVTNDVMTITRWESEAAMGVEHKGLIKGEGVFFLHGEDEQTTLVWQEALRFPWYVGGPLAAFVAAPILRFIWRRNLANFRARF
jgi:hypothetical protein